MAIPASHYPALKAQKVGILAQIGYEQQRQKGSHRVLTAPGRLTIVFAFHDGTEVPPAALRHMLVNRAQLTDAAIIALL